MGSKPVILLIAASVSILLQCSRVTALQEAEPKLIGWGGETYKPCSKASKPWTEVVSWKPRAFVARGFLSEEEARHLRKLSALTLKRSKVIGTKGQSVTGEDRTSWGTFLKRRSDPVLDAVDARVAEWVQLPEENGEDMQVLRYDVDQYYKKHFDGLMDDQAGPRLATVLLYLSDVQEGGETAFPDSGAWVRPDLPQEMGPFSDCARGVVAFKPKLGDALLFWSIKPDGKTLDKASLHTGCPVIRGVKWTATKWFHPMPYQPDKFQNPGPVSRDPGVCEDLKDACRAWAKAGECTKNAGYMIGDGSSVGACRLSCGKCRPCGPGDLSCYNLNRRELDFLELEDISEGSDWLF